MNQLVMGVARNSSGPFQRVSRQAELVSYGEWQELILAILEGSQHRLNWLVLAIFRASQDRLNWLVRGVARTSSCHFESVSRQAELVS